MRDAIVNMLIDGRVGLLFFYCALVRHFFDYTLLFRFFVHVFMYYGGMILTLKEQAIIKNWNKTGITGLRVASLTYLQNIGGPFVRDENGLHADDELREPERVTEMLMKFTLGMMPQGLWDKSEGYCEEICFIAGLDFDYGIFSRVKITEEEDRMDEEFGDFED